ncbi:hydrolase [Croceicoccus estronivorus]|uniref:TIGR01458 family HAD-type hydrolase n=1 Tax=Croceicoccus estronivorus TaxID=1172626 RepID=UPI000830681C|nr:TIGR01458 family HAD-type hydrolase [Croceicoccus estronivorus]OCC22593.1 hydrolase [Croceicoccus estronivorus]
MQLEGVLLDIGGVVYIGDRPLPGAVDAIGRLRDAGIAIRFLTNSTRSPHRVLLRKLRDIGVDVAAEELFTPALAARRLIEEEGLAPHLLIHPSLEEDFAGLPSGDREAVIVGDAGEGFSYAALNAAFRALDRGAAFLALANNRSFRDVDGELSLDAGPFVAALAFASRREPIVLGKPAPNFFESALASMACPAGAAVMIGDDVESDVIGAMKCGLSGVLVRTGKYREGAERDAGLPPDAVADDLAAAVDWLLQRRSV